MALILQEDPKHHSKDDEKASSGQLTVTDAAAATVATSSSNRELQDSLASLSAHLTSTTSQLQKIQSVLLSLSQESVRVLNNSNRIRQLEGKLDELKRLQEVYEEVEVYNIRKATELNMNLWYAHELAESQAAAAIVQATTPLLPDLVAIVIWYTFAFG